jgi:hypothetical protein
MLPGRNLSKDSKLPSILESQFVREPELRLRRADTLFNDFVGRKRCFSSIPPYSRTQINNEASSTGSSVHEIGWELLLTITHVHRSFTYANAGASFRHWSIFRFPPKPFLIKQRGAARIGSSLLRL